ncbi:MAG: hypothetical protein KAG84_03225 [Bacteroidales bacterium]|nr:hypothetical protein [Bacteroidales bacterium]
MERFYITLIFSLFMLQGLAMDSDTTATANKTKAIKLSGGFGAGLTLYGVTGIEPQRPPSFWELRGSININVYNQVNIPFNFNISQQNSNYTHPFNQFGISPHYKAVTLHVGYSVMNFSEYSLNGMNFMGAGIEVMPDKSWVRGKILAGRFIKAVPYTASSTLFLNNPAYERWGYGMMVEVGKPQNNIGLIVFKAQDIPSTAGSIPTDFQLNPAENLILGITTYQRIAKNLSFKGEFDKSAFTSNTNEKIIEASSNTYSNYMGALFQPRLSTSFSYALQASLDYSIKKIGLGIGYKRVGPDYQSMGTVFLDNNREDFLLKIKGVTARNKLTFFANAGLQRSNLDNTSLSSNNRFIGSLNLGYNFNTNLNMAFNYSNFNTSNQINQISHADSVRYVQTTHNIGYNTTYNFKTDNKTHALSFMTNYSLANTLYKTSTFNYVLPDTIIEVTGSERETESGFLNINMGYNMGFIKQSAFISLSMNYSDMRNENLKSQTIGPVLTLGKNLLKRKLRLVLSVNYLNTILDGNSSGNIINERISASYRLTKHHSFRLYVVNVNRTFTDGTRKSYSEFRGGLQYRYSF